MKDLRNSHPGEKALEIVRKEAQNISQNVPLDKMSSGSFEVPSDHGDTIEDDVVDDTSSEEFTGTMTPLPPASWLKETRTTRHADGKFPKHCNGNDRRDGEESPFFIGLQTDLWAKNVPRSCSVRRVASRNLAYTIDVCQLQLSGTTSLVRENVDLTKYQLKSLCVKSGCLTR